MNYTGRVMALQRDDINPMTLQRHIKYEQINSFDEFTVWQKDAWIEDEQLYGASNDTQRKWGQDMHQWLLAQAVLHDDDDIDLENEDGSDEHGKK